MSGKSHACAIIGDTLGDADTDIRTNRHAGAPKRGKQRALRHDPGSAPLQSFSGPLEDLDCPSLTNEHVAREHPRHRAPDDNRLFHRPSLMGAASEMVILIFRTLPFWIVLLLRQ